MRVIKQLSVAGPEVRKVAEEERPSPAPGEVLVRVHATGINPADWKVRAGHVQWFGAPPLSWGTSSAESWPRSAAKAVAVEKGTVEKGGKGADSGPVTRCSAEWPRRAAATPTTYSCPRPPREPSPPPSTTCTRRPWASRA
ncbi:alcohol dehydrogenase catalytic domain-containing protein [Streptomyces antimycoticus]